MMKRVKLVVVLIPLLIIISLMIGLFNQHDFNSIKGIVSLHLSKDKMVEMTGPTNALYYISRSTDADEPASPYFSQINWNQSCIIEAGQERGKQVIDPCYISICICVKCDGLSIDGHR